MYPGTEELAELRELLESERELLLSEIRQLVGEPSADPGDSADQAVADLTCEMLYELQGHDTDRLRNVEDALVRMEEGSYGRCLKCGKTIPMDRLRAIPTARYGLDCQEAHELQEELHRTPIRPLYAPEQLPEAKI